MSEDDVTTAVAQTAESTQLPVSGSRDSPLSNQQPVSSELDDTALIEAIRALYQLITNGEEVRICNCCNLLIGC